MKQDIRMVWIYLNKPIYIRKVLGFDTIKYRSILILIDDFGSKNSEKVAIISTGEFNIE